MHIWGNGKTVRDYLFIDDFIKLLLLLLQQTTLEPGTQIFNVGSERDYSLNQLCKLVEKITNQTVLREYHPTRTVDVHQIILNTSLVKTVYGWQAQTPFKDGLQKSWQWWEKNIIMNN